MRLISKTKVYAAPGAGMSAYENTYYSRNHGLEKIRLRLLDVSDDVAGEQSMAFSSDNGKTWPETQLVPTAYKVEGGTLRQWWAEHFVDPHNGRQVIVTIEGVFPTDSSEHGFTQYYLKYRVSEDGGRTALKEERAIQHGHTAEHPFPGIWIGKNAFMSSAPHSIVALPGGEIVMAICKSVLGADGKLYNPLGNFSWLEVLIVHGKWRADGGIEWAAGATISLTPKQTSRGIFEPTLALMPDGRLLMIMRASNGGAGDPQGLLPACKWHCVSSDGGKTWSTPTPWAYSDGQPFFSPSSWSQLLPHSNGKLYWLGNIDAEKPVGNGTRDMLYIGEVDPHNLALKRDTLFLAARREEGAPATQLSNFTAHEDRETTEIVLHLPWFFEQSKNVWGADSFVFRISAD